MDIATTNHTDMDMNTTTGVTLDAKSFLGDIFLIAACLGGVGNGLVLYVYFKSSKLIDTTMKLIMHLSLTDLVTAVALGMNFVGVRLKLVGVSYMSCLLFMIVPNYMFFVSQSVLGINTLDRYIAICHYEKYTRIMTRKALNIMLAAAWVLPIFLLSIPFFGFNYWDQLNTCRWRNLLYEWVYITNSSVIIVLVVISALIYLLILKKAWEFYRRLLPSYTSVSEEEKEKIRAKKRAIKNGKVMGVVTLVFTICWLPSNIFQFWFGLHFQGYDTAIGRALFFGTMNCIVNPFVYAWQKKDFRKEAKKETSMLREKKSSSKKRSSNESHKHRREEN